jgi:hypothetical protein
VAGGGLGAHEMGLGQDMARAAEGAHVHVVMVDPDAAHSLRAAA